MIGQLTGIVTTHERNPVILTVGGVGFEVHIPPRLLAKTGMNSKQVFFVHTHVREDALELYGFLTQEELDLFHMLLTVSGIGPRTALLVCDRGAGAVKNAISESDVDFFTTVPRLGKKNAQKIIIELKNKLGSLKDLDLTDYATSETKQVIDALSGMGFARNEILSVIKKLETADTTLEQKIRHALQLLSRPVT